MKIEQETIERKALLKTVPCRFCKAKIGEDCRKKNGEKHTNPWQWHADRRIAAIGPELTPAKMLKALHQSPPHRKPERKNK